MKNISKVLLAITLGLCSLTNIEAKKTNKIQILINPAASWFVYRMNAGAGLEANPLAPRPAGATYIANGLIYPGGTIDTKHQCSFLVSKCGVPLTEANSIGMFWEDTAVLQDYTLLVPKTSGDVLNQSVYSFNFKNGETSLFGTGFGVSTGIIAPHEAALKGLFAEQGGTEDNQGADHQFKIKFIPAPGLTALVIEVKFEKSISID